MFSLLDWFTSIERDHHQAPLMGASGAGKTTVRGYDLDRSNNLH
jgi:hypothetical protein